MSILMRVGAHTRINMRGCRICEANRAPPSSGGWRVACECKAHDRQTQRASCIHQSEATEKIKSGADVQLIHGDAAGLLSGHGGSAVGKLRGKARLLKMDF